MRILIATWHRHIVGGAEAYLQTIIPALLKRGHELALVHGYKAEADREVIDSAQDRLPRWCCQEVGLEASLRRLDKWKPDVVYMHTVESPILESALVNAYPSVLFAHGYNGTCATARKCHAWPHPTPCSRSFGPMCLVLHYPRRCCGLNPLTMLRNYQVQSQRNALLPRYAAVMVASRHMYNEFENNGVDGARLHLVPLPTTNVTPDLEAPIRRAPTGRLLLMGRLVDLKGGAYLLQAISDAAPKLNLPLSLIVAGTGSEKTNLRALASKLGIPVDFAGWLSGNERLEAIRNCDLLAVPSLWPEPFGLAGIEAACLGVPAVGYAVGGIPDWLNPGVSGELAPGNPPTVEGLSDAIVRTLSDPDHHHRLRLGAWNKSRQFSLATHLDKLETVLGTVAQRHLSAMPQ